MLLGEGTALATDKYALRCRSLKPPMSQMDQQHALTAWIHGLRFTQVADLNEADRHTRVVPQAIISRLLLDHLVGNGKQS